MRPFTSTTWLPVTASTCHHLQLPTWHSLSPDPVAEIARLKLYNRPGYQTTLKSSSWRAKQRIFSIRLVFETLVLDQRHPPKKVKTPEDLLPTYHHPSLLPPTCHLLATYLPLHLPSTTCHCLPLPTCNYLPHLATFFHSLYVPLPATFSHPLPATTCHYLPLSPPANTCQRFHLPQSDTTSTCHYLPLPATACHYLLLLDYQLLLLIDMCYSIMKM